jgi:serine protease Do
MKRAVGYGLVLLAASAGTLQQAWAWGPEFGAGGPAHFFSGGPARNGQGYLGVDVRDVASDQINGLRLKDARGAEIVLVDHDAPAGKADLRVHDVVLQMNGQAIDGQDQLRRMLHDSPPGKTVQFLISRDGVQMTVTTQMANREEVERQAWEQHLTVPDPQTAPTESAASGYSVGSNSSGVPARGNSFLGNLLMNPSYTGAMLEKMSNQLADYFGVSSGAGLLVRSVVPNSPAANAGMRAGDVVVRANARSVRTTNDWAKSIKNSHGQPLTVVVLRDKKEQTLTLTPDGKKRSSVEGPADDDNAAAVAHPGLSWLPGF